LTRAALLVSGWANFWVTTSRRRLTIFTGALHIEPFYAIVKRDPACHYMTQPLNLYDCGAKVLVMWY
jgi:hypothetical protein